MSVAMPDIPAEAYYIYGHKRYLVALGLALTLFISALDSTIVAVALPTIGADFNEYQQTSWLVTSYLLTYTAFLPVVSKLTDIVGRKPVLIVSTLFFMLWSGACGGAKSMTQLIVFRALQGIGGSAIYSGVVVTISTIVPREKVGAYTPIIGTVFAASSVSGPLIGGAIVQHVHWGWIFFVNLPIGAVASSLLFYALSDPDLGPMSIQKISQRIDWIGSFLLLAASVLLAFSLQVGGTDGYPWVSVQVLAPLIISFCILPVFAFVETRHPEPVIPLRLFRVRNICFILIFTLALGAGLFSHAIFLPQRMQVVDGVSPVTAGVRMLPLLLPVGCLSPFAGAMVMLTKSYRPLMWFASSIGAIGAGLLSTVTVPTKFSHIYGFEAMVGFSIGVTITASTLIIQFCAERRDLAAATGLQTFIRQLGGLVAIAISTAILNDSVEKSLGSNARLASSPGLLEGILKSPTSVLPSLDPATSLIIRQAYSKGFSVTFIQASAWLAVGALATFGLVHYLPDRFLDDEQTKGEVLDPEKAGAGSIDNTIKTGETSGVANEPDEPLGKEPAKVEVVDAEKTVVNSGGVAHNEPDEPLGKELAKVQVADAEKAVVDSGEKAAETGERNETEETTSQKL
ncbi:drug resistance subfamily [Moniliophthora roreri MCA 2997]|uniref:Drug resistance subfamily n=1 Tax=Moniliophthora roreri (strain MCA 2997) TaxID=1381753 RepID=V2X859_MONRO|nr:drug resistance subfamily [Moniliophthora roreri MCA 2997]KAI3605905.1 drug resistance subfamily [Moniliophthora roreri]